jgi:hypothetical protein
MVEHDDPQELERRIQQAARIASQVNDPTTVERLRAWIEDLRQRLRQRREARRDKQEITGRAHEIWERNGRPSGRDLEFWLQAEAEINGRSAVITISLCAAQKMLLDDLHARIVTWYHKIGVCW